MGVITILPSKKITSSDIAKASEEYGSYIKVVADIDKNIITIGGQWHADGEKQLLEQGSKQENLWGGGIDLKTKTIETTALINLRPNQNNSSQDILDGTIREKFVRIVKEKFGL